MSNVVKREIRPRPWSKLSQAEAEATDAWLAELAQRTGMNPYEANAIDTIDDAVMADKTCPFRKHLTWDGATAIRNWRKHQIRNLIGSYEIVTTFEDGAEEVHRANKNIVIENVGCDEKPEKYRAYVPTRSFASHPELLDKVIIDHLDRLRYWRNELRVLRIEGIFAELAEKIDEFSESFGQQIEKTVEETQGAIAKANPSLKKKDSAFKTCVLLLMATFVGVSAERLATVTGYDKEFVARVRARCIKEGIWKEEEPAKGHAWRIKNLVIDGFWQDVKKVAG